jgi:N-acetylgalactosamine kinase
MGIDAGELLKMLQAEPQGSLRQLLAENYPLEEQGTAADRYRRLVERFRALFPGAPVCLARAPGRINLIGEHTDYNGLPVFPFAIHRDLAAAFAPRPDPVIALHNLDPAYPSREFRLENAIPPYDTGDWGNYCKAAAQGLLDRFRQDGLAPAACRGLNAVIHGDIPPAAGLSSSSAMVVLGALMLLAANGLEIPRQELATLLARAEHYVGTQGGGMDQAASLLSRAGTALKIDFFPLRVAPVPLPGGYAFVAANSLVTAAKTAEALDKYTRRPIECRLAVAVLKRRLAERFGREVPLERLGDLEAGAAGLPAAELRAAEGGAQPGIPGLRREASRTLHPAPYSLAEIAGILGRTPAETARTYCLRRDGTVFPEPPDGFKLQPRFRHVVEEGVRVEEALAALRAGDIASLGRLMNQSHESCRDLYEISCPELDVLVGICREAGAEGSRLTGAGFGGCTISLVRSERLPGFLDQVARAYYREYLKRAPQDLSSTLFACQAVNGAETLY